MTVLTASIEDACDLTTYFRDVFSLSHIYSTDMYVSHLNSYMSDLVLYFGYFIRGMVWMDRFDVAYAIGTFIRILSMMNLDFVAWN